MIVIGICLNFFSEKYKLNFVQDILPDNYSTVLQQDCPIYIINVKQNTNISNQL